MEVKQISVETESIQVGDVLKLEGNFKDFNRRYEFQKQDEFVKAALMLNYKFSYVNLYFHKLKLAGEMASLIFDLTESTIIKIENYSNKLYVVYTNLFEVILPQALTQGEIAMLSQDLPNKEYTNEAKLVQMLEETEEAYLLGLISIKERENQKNMHYEYSLNKMILENKWGLE